MRLLPGRLLCPILLVLFFAALARADAGTPHLFHFTPPAGAAPAHVSVAGDFNGWSSTTDFLVRGGDGSYSATVKLTPGLLHYKIVCDGKWMADPSADRSLQVDNGFGDVLSGILVPAQGAAAHTIRYVPPAGSPTVPVSVAGDFNGWSAALNPMTRAADGSYSAAVAIAPGLHHYKIVYNGQWIADPGADKSLDADDGFGGKNSGINVP